MLDSHMLHYMAANVARHVFVTSTKLKSLSLYVDFVIVDTDHVGFCWFDVGFEVQYVLYRRFETCLVTIYSSIFNIIISVALRCFQYQWLKSSCKTLQL